MDLFKLRGVIEADNQKAIKALKDTSEEGEKTESKLKNAFGKIGGFAATCGKAIGTGLAVGATAMGALTIKALNMSGELEQNMGGSEAVFGKYADSMQERARNAFMEMGLSTSDFLATANKMGALFQGAGFSIADSANIAYDAMGRAADVASIMGIETSAAMEAIAGAAKGNFTMMDNLGVAMNDTTLQAYALSKGIDKATKDMTNQEKIALAMEMFMEKTAYAAGNYARENETLAGSLSTAKAALTNFLDGSGNVESLVTAFSNAAQVIIRNLGELGPRLVNGLVDIVNQIVPMLPPLLQQLLPIIINGAVSLINGVVAALPMVIDALMAALPGLIDGVVQIVNALIAALPQIMQSLVSALPTLLPQLINGIVSMIIMLCNMLPQIIQPIIDYLPDIIISIVQALVENLPALIEGLITLIMGIIQAIPQIIQALVDAIPTIVSLLIQAILNNLPAIIGGLIQVVWGIVKAIPQIFGSLIQGVGNVFVGIWDGIKNVFSGIGAWFSNVWDSIGKGNPAIQGIKEHIGNVFTAAWNNIKTIFNAVKDYISTVWDSIKNVISTYVQSIWNVIKTIFDSIKNTISTIIDGIKNVISSVWNTIKTIIANVMNIIFSIIKGDWDSVWQSIKNILNAIWNTIQTIWNSIWNVIKSVGQGIWNTIESVFTGAWNTIKSVVNGVKNTISSVFNGIKSVATSVWNGIKLAMTKPIEAARDTIKKIVDKVKGFFSGMKLQFPNIKLPHFSIKPSGWKIGDLLKGSIPKLGIDWYAKAMNNPMIMNKPTIFGYDPKTGNMQAGGEAGSEMVGGVSAIMSMISSAVASQMGDVSFYLQKLIEMLADYFPEILEAMDRPISFDPEAGAAAMAIPMDRQLGIIKKQKERGR